MNKQVKSVVLLVAGFFGFVTLMSSFTTINSGERGVYVVMGKASDTVLTDGFHMKIPFVSSVVRLNTKVQKTEAGTEAASKDMQQVHVVLALNWHIEPTKVNEIFRTLGTSQELITNIITPAVSEVLKASSAKLAAEEILTKRLELKDSIDQMLKARLLTYNIIVDDVSLVNLTFTNEFNKAVEDKQIAEQNAKRADYVALEAEKTAKAIVNKARGESEANKLTQITLTPQLLQWEAIKRWNGVLPTMMSGSGAVPFININPKN